MKRIIANLSISAMTLAACAENSQNVQATYVSPLSYNSYSCKQIEQEARRVSSRAAQASGVQDQNAQGDAVATGIAIVLFWPAAFFVGGNKETTAELARLKGELEALEQASIQKRCGITFNKVTPPPSSKARKTSATAEPLPVTANEAAYDATEG